jgi:hypothetical protein
MPKFIEAECPNCGANLKLTPSLDKAHCEHCDAKFIISDKKMITKGSKSKITCPMCHGKGLTRCIGIQTHEITNRFRKHGIFVESCHGDRKCHISAYPERMGISSNYCVRGRCAWCNGTGRDLLKECSFCGGSGDCRFCQGSGTCTLCNGEGIQECKACNGKGHNIYFGI